MSDLSQYLEDHHDSFEDDLCELLRIKSVSADPEYHTPTRLAARWVAKHLEKIGLKSELIETAGHPLVFAESPSVPHTPTVLVYGHYDVQPPDPLKEWISPPFEPTVRGGNLYARGATDDKGQMLTHFNSVQAWMAAEGGLPLKIKFIIEGEEEVGSESLEAYLLEHTDKLSCDYVVVSDTPQFGPGQPAITYGLRGIQYFKLKLTGPDHDLHSGTFGGSVANPAASLAQILATLFDDNGHIQIPGFYDDVVSLSDTERAQLQGLGFDDVDYMRQIGVDSLNGENGYSTLERRWARPSCDIHGLSGGYQGEGAKTVLPAHASAKFSFRLVPNQDPVKICQTVNAWLNTFRLPGIRSELVPLHGAPAVLVPTDSSGMRAAAQAVEQGFGAVPLFVREGGSIPIISSFCRQLQADALLLGWGLPDDNTHGPNEKFHLADFHRGTKASAYLWKELAQLGNEDH